MKFPRWAVKLTPGQPLIVVVAGTLALERSGFRPSPVIYTALLVAAVLCDLAEPASRAWWWMGIAWIFIGAHALLWQHRPWASVTASIFATIMIAVSMTLRKRESGVSRERA